MTWFPEFEFSIMRHSCRHCCPLDHYSLMSAEDATLQNVLATKEYLHN